MLNDKEVDVKQMAKDCMVFYGELGMMMERMQTFRETLNMYVSLLRKMDAMGQS